MWRKIILFIIGLILTALGVAIVFQQWQAMVLVFKAFVGPILAVVGLVILFASNF